MERTGRGLVLVFVLAAGGLACTTGVRASDVEQACTKDTECVVVEELEQIGARCTVPCQKAAIHRMALDRYNRELARERRDCRTITHLLCDPEEFVAECHFGRCVAVTPSAEAEDSAAATYDQRVPIRVEP